MVTPEFVRSKLHYDPSTGVFTWRDTCTHKSRVGTVAGRLNSIGYWEIGLGSKLYKAHRLAWLYMSDEPLPPEIDHIDGDRANNRWCNLRAATHSLNQQNRKAAHSNNQTGLLGVRVKKRKTVRFQAIIHVNGVRKYLGTFKTADEASAAYLSAKRKLHAGNTI